MITKENAPKCPSSCFTDYVTCYKLQRPPHFCGGAIANIEVGVVESNQPPDEVLSERIANAYKTSLELSMKSDGQWANLFKMKQDIHEALLGNDIQKLAEMLANPSGNDLLYGFEAISKTILKDKGITEKADPYSWMLLSCYSFFIRLGEAWGVERLENPEAYRYATPKYSELSSILNKLNKMFSCNIYFPNPYRGETGLKFDEGIASVRAINALHQTFLIYDKLGRKNVRVLEIGAGTGRTAYYSKTLLGIEDYTIIDLPISGVASAYFLGKSLGRDAVSLYGEKEQPGAIRILPPESFLNGDLGKFDIIINCDSLTEMDYTTMYTYWERIKTCTSTFLSINHENNQHTVREISHNDSAVKAYSRTPYWLRQGYVEEFITFCD